MEWSGIRSEGLWFALVGLYSARCYQGGPRRLWSILGWMQHHISIPEVPTPLGLLSSPRGVAVSPVWVPWISLGIPRYLWVSRVSLGIQGISGYPGYLWVSRVSLGIQGISGYPGYLWVSRVGIWALTSFPPLTLPLFL